MSIPTASEVKDQFLATARKGQETALDAFKAVADRATTAASATHRLPKLEFAADLPRPAGVIANARDLAGKLLDNQRKFAGRVLHTAALPGATKTAESTGTTTDRGEVPEE